MTPATTPPAIGQPWPGQGGIYAGIMRGENGAPDYHLIVSPRELGDFDEVTWGGYGEDESKAASDWDGSANTDALLESGVAHEAVDEIAGLTIDGHTDYYLPSRREAALCYALVPEQFIRTWYWTSTQCSPYFAWCQLFDDGTQSYDRKDTGYRVRAVRRHLVI